MAGFPDVGDQFGDYQITSLLGRGSAGVTFAAVQGRLHRVVTLKVLDPRLAGDEAFAARFAREAQLLATVSSPHIVQIYDHGSVNGFLYLATQFIPGGDLGALIRTHGPLPPFLALDLTQQVVSALADAHANQVLHRDLKPSNVLLAATGDDPFAYVSDFGLAPSEAGGPTQPGAVPGSAAFTAPERHQGAPATERGDLYSAGCVLFAMLTGTAPYAGTDPQLVAQHLNAPLPQLPGNDALTGQLNRILAGCLAKNPGHRFGSATDLLAELSQAAHLATPGAGADPTNLGEAASPSAPGSPMASPIPSSGVTPDPAGGFPAAFGRAEGAGGPSSRRNRTGDKAIPLVVVSVVGALAVIGGIGLALLQLGPSAAPTRGPAATPSVSSTQAAPTPSVPTPTGPASSVFTREPGYTCWNGTEVDELAECPRPTGLKGLLYVFPSLSDTIQDCEKIANAATVRFDCTRDGSILRYRYWPSSSEARRHYATAYADYTFTDLILDDEAVGILYKRSTTRLGRYRLSGLLGDGHFSFSVEAPTTRKRDELFITMMQIRSPSEWNGHRSDTTPGVATIG